MQWQLTMAANRRQNIILSLAAIQLLSALFLLAISADTGAGVYKCVDADGSITYAQTPCPDQVTTTVHTASSNRGDEPLDCEHANRFALSVARSMKNGSASSDTYMKYGGVDAMSKSAVNIVSYVHSFQHSNDITADRIAALSGNRCQARAFGAVSCESLPVSFTDSIGGCDSDEDSDAEPVANATAAATANSSDLGAGRAVTTASSSNQAAIARDEERRATCIESRKTEIERINNSMRGGYTSAQGETYRKRLRELRTAINDC